MKKLFQRRQGFTLIELLIVIVIIGILAVGFAPTLLSAPKKARDGVRKGQIASIQQAVEAYALDKSSVYPATGTGCIGDDLTKAPSTDLATYFQGGVVTKNTPIAGDADVCTSFGYMNDSTYYYISVKLETSATAGNSAKAAKDKPADNEIGDGKGQYYVVKVKY